MDDARVTPLQKIAMGLVLVLIPANFPANPSPEWAFYDALPDPVGWLMVVLGLRDLRRGSELGLGTARMLAVIALLVSIPMWIPQVNHLLVVEHNPDLPEQLARSIQWFLSLPQTLFGLLLAREIGTKGTEVGDRYLATRFGLLCWGFGALVVLPVVAYGGGVDDLVMPTLVAIAIVNIAFIYYLFASHRREVLGGPGPRDWVAEARARSARNDEPPSP